jgi:hypothetical protein
MPTRRSSPGNFEHTWLHPACLPLQERAPHIKRRVCPSYCNVSASAILSSACGTAFRRWLNSSSSSCALARVELEFVSRISRRRTPPRLDTIRAADNRLESTEGRADRRRGATKAMRMVGARGEERRNSATAAERAHRLHSRVHVDARTHRSSHASRLVAA